ncbi:MAG TPA: hypothetical protein VEW48_03145 [Thermoanaerobaculia bacterium]|nr:hypothetical protein [Thermoanaerobaculia bacterium]
MSSSSRRKIGVLLVAAVLLAPWTAAAEPGAWKDPSGTQAPWGLLAQLWNAVAALWGDNGCSMDPNGGCAIDSATPAPTENLDEGCKIDPFGGCREGSTLPVPTENLDEGCSMDPFGGCGNGR